MVLSLAGLLYIPLKRWIPKNLLTAVAWTAAVFGLSLEGLALDARTGFAIAALLLTIASNANLCDLPDVERDREARVRGFGPWLGVHATARIAGSFGLLGALCAVAAGAWALCVPAILYGVLGWVFAERLAEERSLRVWIDAALILPGPISLLL
jgi:4-hydroxybenzoate polyprenyltransferase